MPAITIVGAAAPPGTVGTAVVEARPGDSLFDAAAKVSAGVDTACVGKGTCGLCRVKVLAGAEHLNPYTDEERRHLGNVYHLTKVRLACRCRPTGDVTIEIVRRKK
jgi:ferredoxin